MEWILFYEYFIYARKKVLKGKWAVSPVCVCCLGVWRMMSNSGERGTEVWVSQHKVILDRLLTPLSLYFLSCKWGVGQQCCKTSTNIFAFTKPSQPTTESRENNKKFLNFPLNFKLEASPQLRPLGKMNSMAGPLTFLSVRAQKEMSRLFLLFQGKFKPKQD